MRLPCGRVSPTVLRQGPYRFYFYAGDRGEPPHVHVEGLGGQAKFWLRPVTLADAWGYSTRQVGMIRRLVNEYQESFLGAWDAFFRS